MRPLPTNCHKTSGAQWTPLSSRVIVWLSANMIAPKSASGAIQENICGEGLSAMMTPTKPIEDGDPAEALDLLAEQRRRERGDDERRRHIEGHHVGERHEARRVVERERVDRGDKNRARPAAAPGAGR